MRISCSQATGHCHINFFTKSKNSVKHTFSEMFEKLCNVIKFTISPCNDNDEAMKTTLKPLDIRTDLYNESKKNLHKKITDSREETLRAFQIF